jgi:hypothetical protein
MASINVNANETRIAKLRLYLFNITDSLLTGKDYQINADMLDIKANNYSLDKIPTSSEVESWITGDEIHRDVFSFRSRNFYSQDTINNLKNIGFFESFEEIIKQNNKNNILPDIAGIQDIKCLNTGTMNNADTSTAEFDIQIQITYLKTDDEEITSL